MSFAQLFTTQIRNNVQSNSGLHLQCYRIFISKGGKEESAQLIGLTIPHFRSYSLLISQQCSKPHDFSCMFLPVPELAPVQRDPVDKSCNGRCQAEHQDCDNTGYHAKYSIAKITKINSLIRLNSLGTNPNLTILFLQFVTSPRITSMLKTLPSILLEAIAHSCKTHSEFRIFWWKDFIQLGKLL